MQGNELWLDLLTAFEPDTNETLAWWLRKETMSSSSSSSSSCLKPVNVPQSGLTEWISYDDSHPCINPQIFASFFSSWPWWSTMMMNASSRRRYVETGSLWRGKEKGIHRMRTFDKPCRPLDRRESLTRLLSGQVNKNNCEIQEPTSGLDSSTAHSLMQLLKDYAVRERKTVITTIHQPSSQIFHMFDKLLLMSGGQVAYFGDVNSVVPFFSSVGFQMSAHYNPADFVMEKIKGDPRDAEKIIKAAKDIQAFPELIHSSSTRHTCSSRHTQNGSSSHPQIVVNSSFHSPDEDLPLKSSEEDTEPSEKHVLWSHNDDNDDSHQKSDVRVVVDPRDRNHKVYSRVVNDCDSGRASWTEGVMDGRSTKTYSSSSASSSCASTCSGEMYFDFTHGESESCRKEEKWAASFWTQLKVLTARNFYEARGRMLSKLNWIQTIGLAFVTGSIWYQIKRTEDTLVDVKGWMFFSMTYWMLFALFNAMVSFPPEREVINKERASGAYRLSSYYVAKMIGELPLTLAMPTTFHFISYPLLGHSNLHTFLILWVFQVLSSVVAQSVGLFIGAATLDLEVSITISALYSMSSILFGGFYSTTMPPFLAWIRYFSMVYYAFQNMLMIEFSVGSPVLWVFLFLLPP